MARYIVATKFESTLVVQQGEVINKEPLTIRNKNGDIIDLTEWSIKTDFNLSNEQEKLVDDVLDKPSSISDIDMKNAQSTLSDIASKKIRDVSDNYSIQVINYEDINHSWIRKYKIFKSHESAIEEISNIQIQQSPLLNSDEELVFLSTK